MDLAKAGCAPSRRALNFAATNAYQAADELAEMVRRGMALDVIDTKRSALCRRDRHCRDVALRFFDPDRGGRARRRLWFTIDVSDVVLVALGEIRIWPDPRRARAAA